MRVFFEPLRNQELVLCAIMKVRIQAKYELFKLGSFKNDDPFNATRC